MIHLLKWKYEWTLTLNTKLELENVGLLSFTSNTSTLKIRTVCLGGIPLSVAATAILYTDLSSWSSMDLVLMTPVNGSMVKIPYPSVSRPAKWKYEQIKKLEFCEKLNPKTEQENHELLKQIHKLLNKNVKRSFA